MELDQKVNQIFPGKVVRKDLVRKIKVGANVPVYVLEYLLGKYCATDDENAIEAGLQLVQATLIENYVRPDESIKAQSIVKERGHHTFIDKVKVRLLASEDKYWAELKNFGYKYVHIQESLVRKYDRLLNGGLWAQIEMVYSYDETASGKKHPFRIDTLKPIQIGTFSIEEYEENRRHFTTEEWIDLIIRTIGLEASHFNKRQKLILLTRLIPMVERNYNLIELGPRGTGKSYAYEEISPYVILMTGPTTVANLFYNMSTGKIGLVGLWDAIAFDEVADLNKMPKEVVSTLKTYCESGRFARGKESLEATASIAFFGNINQPVETLVKTTHLFSPLPEVIRDDMAFLDRIHYYIPGWDVPKMKIEYFTNHYGFVIDFFSEALHALLKENFTEVIDRHFLLGSHLNARDVKAVRKTVSGLIKLIHPDGNFTKDELAEYVEFALEGRRRVKEQLKKMGSFEYYQTSFSFIDKETQEEHFVGVPEEGGRNLIANDPLPPGMVYAASVSNDGSVGIFRIEVGVSAGTGKLKTAGGLNKDMHESVKRAFAFLMGHKVNLGVGKEMDTNDFHIQAVDLVGAANGSDIGIAVIIAIMSAVRKTSVLPGLVIMGDLSIGGTIKPVPSLKEPLQMAEENGAKKVLIPIENKRNFFDVPSDVVAQVDPVFYTDSRSAVMKALGIN
ncbi:protease Lon-related BREX system protein BrxL [Calditrichota bacterium GD2]